MEINKKWILIYVVGILLFTVLCTFIVYYFDLFIEISYKFQKHMFKKPDFDVNAYWFPTGNLIIELKNYSPEKIDSKSIIIKIDGYNYGMIYKYCVKCPEISFSDKIILKIPNARDLMKKESILTINYEGVSKSIKLNRTNYFAPEIIILSPKKKVFSVKENVRIKVKVNHILKTKCKILDKTFSKEIDLNVKLKVGKNIIKIDCEDEFENKFSKTIILNSIEKFLNPEIKILGNYLNVSFYGDGNCKLYLNDILIDEKDCNECRFTEKIPSGTYKLQIKCKNMFSKPIYVTINPKIKINCNIPRLVYDFNFKCDSEIPCYFDYTKYNGKNLLKIVCKDDYNNYYYDERIFYYFKPKVDINIDENFITIYPNKGFKDLECEIYIDKNKFAFKPILGVKNKIDLNLDFGKHKIKVICDKFVKEKEVEIVDYIPPKIEVIKVYKDKVKIRVIDNSKFICQSGNVTCTKNICILPKGKIICRDLYNETKIEVK